MCYQTSQQITSQDTVIDYVANKAKLVVKYVDEKGKDLIPPETTEGKVGSRYTTTGSYYWLCIGPCRGEAKR